MVFGMKTIGLLGTRLILERDFLKKRLLSKYHLRAIVPGE